MNSPQRKALLHAYAIALERKPLEGIEPALKRCTVPTRIVWGTSATIFSPASPDYLDRTFPRSRGVRRVAGAKLCFPEGAKVDWWAKTVQLDLEAKGVVAREKTKPLRWRRA